MSGAFSGSGFRNFLGLSPSALARFFNKSEFSRSIGLTSPSVRRLPLKIHRCLPRHSGTGRSGDKSTIQFFASYLEFPASPLFCRRFTLRPDNKSLSELYEFFIVQRAVISPPMVHFKDTLTHDRSMRSSVLRLTESNGKVSPPIANVNCAAIRRATFPLRRTSEAGAGDCCDNNRFSAFHIRWRFRAIQHHES